MVCGDTNHGGRLETQTMVEVGDTMICWSETRRWRERIYISETEPVATIAAKINFMSS